MLLKNMGLSPVSAGVERALILLFFNANKLFYIHYVPLPWQIILLRNILYAALK